MSTGHPVIAPVRKTITVRATPERAFRVFTEGVDTWWPRTHHIGKSPMKRVVIEAHAHGRCYSEQVDGTECDWGRILVWEPPHRFVLAWQVSPNWEYESELAKSSEVEVRFTPEPNGVTRVDLEHRHFERHGGDANALRMVFDGPEAWSGMLRLFQSQVGAENTTN